MPDGLNMPSLLKSRTFLQIIILLLCFGASETQNCRNSIIAPGRQEIGFGSLTGLVKLDCPGAFLPSVPSVTSESPVFS